MPHGTVLAGRGQLGRFVQRKWRLRIGQYQPLSAAYRAGVVWPTPKQAGRQLGLRAAMGLAVITNAWSRRGDSPSFDLGRLGPRGSCVPLDYSNDFAETSRD
jgi:hypothetical protein